METKLRKIRNEDEISKLLILGKNPDVDSLSFRDCHLAARGGIPQFLSTFTHLKSLDLKNNLLNDLPSFFSCLTSLTFIHLGLNRITRLDPLEKLPNLTNICLNNNRFNNFPPEVFKFTHLKVLDLSKNDISQIPTGFFNFKNLSSFLSKY
jgi:Leucine-rich repeat (LRR) protein